MVVVGLLTACQTEKEYTLPLTADEWLDTPSASPLAQETPCQKNDPKATESNSSFHAFPSFHPISIETWLNPMKDQFIKGVMGTKVFIPANAFDLSSVPAGAKIAIRLDEFLTPEDLFQAQLTTQCDGAPLISGGSVRIQAFYRGKTLLLKEGQSITLFFKKDTARNDRMMAFYGERNDNGSMNWPAYTPSWKDEWVECGYDERIQHLQDSLFPQMRVLRDSMMKTLVLTEKEKDWILNQHAYNRHPRFFLTKHRSGMYMLDQKYFSYYTASMKIRQQALHFFSALIQDSLAQRIGRSISFTPAVDRKPFYAGDHEWMKRVIKEYKGDTAQLRTHFAELALNHYILNATQMGYINCDRFYGYPNNDQRLVVQVPDHYKGKVQMIIPRVNGLYEGKRDGQGDFVFTGLPKGLPFVLMGFHYQHGHVDAFFEKGQTGNQTIPSSSPKRYREDQFVAKVKEAAKSRA